MHPQLARPMYSLGGHQVGNNIIILGHRRRRVSAGFVPRCALMLKVVNISKTKEKWADTACDDYALRVKKMGVELEQVSYVCVMHVFEVNVCMNACELRGESEENGR